MKKTTKLLPFLALTFAALLFGCSKGYEPVLYLDDYIQRHKEPFLAMQKCIFAANCYPSFKHEIELSPTLYKCDKSPADGFFIDLQNMRDITIDGKGAVVSLDAYNSFLRAVNCENVVIKNITVEYHRRGVTQGSVKEVNAADGYFLYVIDKGFPTLPSDKWAKMNYGKDAWQWGVVVDRISRTCRASLQTPLYIEKVDALDNGEYKIYPEAAQKGLLAKISAGDAFVLRVPMERNLRIEARTEPEFMELAAREGDAAICTPKFLACASIYGGKNISFENVHMRNVRGSGIVFTKNKGFINLSDCSIKYAGAGDLVSSWGSAIVATDNKYGPIVKNCAFEGMMEDCIDLACRPSYVVKKIDEHTYEVEGESLQSDDKLGIFYPDSGEWIDFVRIVSGGGNLIKTNRPIPNLVIADAATRADFTATQFYNMDKINGGAAVLGTAFGTQRRHAIITNAHDNRIEENKFSNIGGCAIIASNELARICSGPLPYKLTISHNIINGTISTPVVIGAQTVGGAKVSSAFDVSFIDNEIRLAIGAQGCFVKLTNGSGYNFAGNRFYDISGAEVATAAAVEVGADVKNVNFQK